MPYTEKIRRMKGDGYMLPRWKIILTASLLLSLMNIAAPVLADPIDGVVGTGTAVSCTSAAGLDDLQDEINDGGLVTFNCGAAPVTIPVTTTLEADADVGSINATLDGDGLITLDGQNARRIFFQRTYFNNGSTLTLQNMTLINGRASGVGTLANGGAIQSVFGAAQPSIKPVLNIDNVTFIGNVSNQTGASGYDFGGGAIFSQGGFVTVMDSTFTDNDANNAGGGAIHILQSGLTIADSTFTDNTAGDQGGAIYVDGVGGGSGVFSIVRSRFSGSRSRNSGGAIYVNMYEDTNSFTVDRTSFIDNAVTTGTRAQGGAICGGSTNIGGGTGNASITITNSLFADNFAGVSNVLDGSGGALNFNQRARVTIANSTFNNNRANGFTNTGNANGGAIVIINNTTQFQIINSTISNNFASWLGGGISSSPNGILRNTILAYNTATGIANFQQHCTTELAEAGFNLQYPPRLTNANFFNDVTCFAGKSAPNQTGLPEFQDPLLSPLTNNGGPTLTRALQSGSPAIDTGSNAICAAVPINNLDQRGQTRPVDGDGLNDAQCDVGAFEFVSNQPPFAPTLSAPLNDAALTGTFTVFSWQPAPFATSYRLRVDDDANFSSPVVDETISATSFIPAYIGIGTFSWKVEAININGNEESLVRTFTLSSAPNAVPTRNFTDASGQILTWSPLTWAVGYQVEIATDLGFTDIFDTSAVLPANADSYTASLEPGIYYWRVKGQKSDLTFGTPSAAEMLTVGSG
jgi:predicted outer membrane repeat protein